MTQPGARPCPPSVEAAIGVGKASGGIRQSRRRTDRGQKRPVQVFAAQAFAATLRRNTLSAAYRRLGRLRATGRRRGRPPGALDAWTAPLVVPTPTSGKVDGLSSHQALVLFCAHGVAIFLIAVLQEGTACTPSRGRAAGARASAASTLRRPGRRRKAPHPQRKPLAAARRPRRIARPGCKVQRNPRLGVHPRLQTIEQEALGRPTAHGGISISRCRCRCRCGCGCGCGCTWPAAAPLACTQGPATKKPA